MVQDAERTKDYKARTKGKFNEHVAQDPGSNFVKDITWLKKANPLAAYAEKKFLDRDMELLEKRRF